ncbi:MAG: hypothetical protein ACQESC_01380 [Nanobdellota archaeon]
MKKLMMVMIALVGVVMTVGMAFAATPQGANVESNTDEGEFAGVTAGTVDVTDGHIYNNDLNTTMSTYRWSGIYGNVSGNIVLSDDDSDVLYDWTAQGRLVYASEGTPDWTTLGDAVEGDVTTAYAHLGGTDSDNYATTFTGTSEDIGSGLFSINSDFAQTYDNETTASWKTYSLTDGSSNIVFAGLVQPSGAASYKGSTVDYQMIVPEDGTVATGTGTTTYNLYAELQ